MDTFLRWAGGKTWLKKTINNYIPDTFNNYFEPFLGGGSIYFELKIDGSCYLSDLNKELIDTYKQVRDNVEDIIIQLKQFKNTESDYYRIRETQYEEPCKNAAKFIYLNMTSFNGIYRVNRSGKYNVPFGHRYTIDYIQESTLRKASLKLKNANLINIDFEEQISNVRSNDFVFLDPPYTVAHSDNGFIGYNQKLFSLDDQLRLARCLKHLNKIGAKYLLTNAKHPKIEEIYSGLGTFITLKRMSLIGGKDAKRGNIEEYLIRNY